MTQFAGYDIIGDVHGCATALRRLLHKLGYRETAQGFAWASRSRPRQAIFVGDLIDRGSQIAETLSIVRSMWEQGQAQVVMGNHEFNAIAYHTPLGQGFLRPHNERTDRQIKATLDQFADDPQQLQRHLQWFRSLPFFLEFDNFRVVHALWDQALIDDYWRRYQDNRLVDELLPEVAEKGSFAQQFVERLTTGLNLPLPAGQQLVGRDGFMRRSFRVHFWDEAADTYDDIVFQPDPLPAELRARPLSDAERNHLVFYDARQKPLLVGHYWLRGAPALMRPNIACLDYSAVNSGKLVAYRIEAGDRSLLPQRFVWVDCGQAC